MTSINSDFNFSRTLFSERTLWWYVVALFIKCFGLIMAAQYYPGGFDWFYTVASALASHKHNPDGSVWFASSLSLSMLLLWFYLSSMKRELMLILPEAGYAIVAIRIGLVFGFLLGVERLIIYDLSHMIDKAHELIAIFTLLGLYIGILSLLIQFIQLKKNGIFPLLLIAGVLVPVGIIGLSIYIEQRDLGWVDTDWRMKGIPVWLSFAFWQWLAIGFLWVGLGLLYTISAKKYYE